MKYRHDPDGARLPIKLDATTNGEFAPIPLEPVHRHARHLALEAAASHARCLGQSRRAFLVSACGAATALLGMNAAYASAGGRRGGYFELDADAALDLQLARSALDTGEFIFDVQGHFVNPTGAWTNALPSSAQPLLSFAQNKRCEAAARPGRDYLQCLDSDAFIKDVFLDSDTDLVVLSFVPSTRKGEPLTIEEAAATARIVETMKGTHRLLLHGRVNPNQAGDLEGMDNRKERASSSTMMSALPSSRRRASSGSRTSPFTRACRSARSPTSIRRVSTWAASPSAIPTSTFSSITPVSLR